MKTKSHFPNFAAKVKAAGVDPNDWVASMMVAHSFIDSSLKSALLSYFGLFQQDFDLDFAISSCARGERPILIDDNGERATNVEDLFIYLFEQVDKACA